MPAAPVASGDPFSATLAAIWYLACDLFFANNYMDDSDPANLLRKLFDIQTRQWVNVAVHTVFVHDVFLTSLEEYRFVWKANWSVGKILYILVRYPYNVIILIMNLYIYAIPTPSLSLKFCQGLVYWQTLGSSTQLLIVQTIIGLRTAALYDFQLGIVILLAFMGCVSCVTIFTVDVLYLKQLIYEMSSVGPQFGVGCIVSCPGPGCVERRRFMFLIMLILDSVLCSLTFWKYIQQAKRDGSSRTPLLSVLYRDGFIYFAAIISTVFVNFVIYMTVRPTLVGVGVPLLRSLAGIMCARLLLNLRGAVLKTSSHCTSTSVPSSRFTEYAHTGVSADLGVWDNRSSRYPPNFNTSYQSYPNVGDK